MGLHIHRHVYTLEQLAHNTGKPDLIVADVKWWSFLNLCSFVFGVAFGTLFDRGGRAQHLQYKAIPHKTLEYLIQGHFNIC